LYETGEAWKSAACAGYDLVSFLQGGAAGTHDVTQPETELIAHPIDEERAAPY
jgi:hypothetical protein